LQTWLSNALCLSPRLDQGFQLASEDLRPERRFVVYSAEEGAE
jgi:hypothetical protein